MRLSSLALAAALLAASGVAHAAPAPACAKPDCVKPDTTVSATGYGRALIAADPAVPGRLFVGGEEPGCGWNRQSVHLSTDDGASWSGSCLPFPDDFYGVADESPAVAIDPKGTLLVAATYDDGADSDFIGVHNSTDGGATWNFVFAAGTTYFKGDATHVHLAVDTSPKSPYRGSAYVVYTAIGLQDDGTHIRIARSTDGGWVWTAHYASPEYSLRWLVDDASLAIGRDGALYLTYIKCKGSDLFGCDKTLEDILLSVSHDGGLTWESRGTIATVALPSHRPVLAIDASKGPNQGRLYLVTDDRAGERNVVMVRSSADQGATWTAPMRVASGKATQFVPWASVSDRGDLAITWMDTRNDPEGKKFQPMLALSKDGAVSFSKPVALDAELTDPSQSWGDDRVSHVWSGGLLRAAFHGPNADGSRGIRAGGLAR